MRTKRIGILLTILVSMVATKVFAYDIAVENEDGVTIYYDYFKNGEQLSVTYFRQGRESYTGVIVIPDEITTDNITRKVTAIGAYAFNNCKRLTSVTIPNSVTVISSSAFEDCSSLSSVTIPNSVHSIGTAAFYGCSSLTSVTIPNGVTSINGWTFYCCSSLSSVTIPNSVTSIGIDAFYRCINLTSVTLSNNLTTISSTAFCGCNSLTSITIPNSVTSIGDSAFGGCIGLTSITIPNSVTSIGDGAFFGISLSSVTIPNSVTSIGNSAFRGCNELNSITVNSGNPVYDSRNNCNAIIETSSNTLIQGCKNTTIPNSVTSIGNSAFSYNVNLTSVMIPNSVTSIGNWVFNKCESLLSVISMIEEPFPIDIIFPDNTYYNGTLYVPVGTIDKYREVEGWNHFEHIKEQETLGINTILVSEMPVIICAENGVVSVEGAEDGMNVSIYTIDGVHEGAAMIRNGAAMINTNISRDSVAIVKIGNKSVKVVMK